MSNGIKVFYGAQYKSASASIKSFLAAALFLAWWDMKTQSTAYFDNFLEFLDPTTKFSTGSCLCSIWVRSPMWPSKSAFRSTKCVLRTQKDSYTIALSGIWVSSTRISCDICRWFKLFAIILQQKLCGATDFGRFLGNLTVNSRLTGAEVVSAITSLTDPSQWSG